MFSLADQFHKYYSTINDKDLAVSNIRQRELAFLQFGERLMIRHLSFADEKSVKKYLLENTPAHVYYSSAYYQYPQDQNMERKGWMGADLIFDIDADHIPTECKNDHDTWKCLDCQTSGKGFPPESCPECCKKRIEATTWVCEKCLAIAKGEIFKLIDEYLAPDFGVSTHEIEICFSGHRGYHLHIMNEDLKKLNNDGRREIADYVRGIGLDPELHGFKLLNNNEPLIGPDIYNKGWRGRLAKSVYAYLSKCDLKELHKLESRGEKETDQEYRDRVLTIVSKKSTWWGGLTPGTIKNFKKVALNSIKDIACNIDERVTIDTKRLIRYPNSLHGKSGLKTCRISYNDLDGFDPLKDAIAFKGSPVKVYVRDIPRIRIGDDEIGPIDKKEVEVSRAMGIYLICRGAAEPRVWSDV